MERGWLLVCGLAVALACGCGRRLGAGAAAREARADSAGATVRVTERWRVDTVYVELPAARDSVVGGARDTASRLENAAAVSWCAVGADGRLRHSLRSKGGRVAAVAPVVVERARDCVMWRVREARVEVPVEVEARLTAYQRAAVGAFPWLVGALALLAAVKVLRVARRWWW